jgi:predicted secreted protein
VELRVGEKTTIRLPGLATSGYRWTAHASGDAVTVSTRPADPGRRTPGANADEIVEIEGRRPGRATVTLEPRRSWEDRPEPYDRRVLDITVV